MAHASGFDPKTLRMRLPSRTALRRRGDHWFSSGTVQDADGKKLSAAFWPIRGSQGQKTVPSGSEKSFNLGNTLLFSTRVVQNFRTEVPMRLKSCPILSNLFARLVF